MRISEIEVLRFKILDGSDSWKRRARVKDKFLRCLHEMHDFDTPHWHGMWKKLQEGVWLVLETVGNNPHDPNMKFSLFFRDTPPNQSGTSFLVEEEKARSYVNRIVKPMVLKILRESSLKKFEIIPVE